MAGIRDSFEQLVEYKAERMLSKAKYRIYLTNLLGKLKITSPEEAFLAGAIDAMIYDVGLNLGQSYARHTMREALVEKIFKTVK